MKILYVTTDDADYLQDSLLYGLRKKLGADVVDWPRKDIMYKDRKQGEIYGKGFTLWGLLDDIKLDRDNIIKRCEDGEFDYFVFGSVYRQQLLFAHCVNYKRFTGFKCKFAFIDGEDDGYPTVYDAIRYGPYFKRENPWGYKIQVLGLSIPQEKMLMTPPKKDKMFTKHTQCLEAYKIQEVAMNCVQKVPFDTEDQYYEDLSRSIFGITMKKSGWDVPRHIENAGHYVINCIYAHSDWDKERWEDKPAVNHPLGLKDMENCIIWHDPQELIDKVKKIDWEAASLRSRLWADTKTCEYMTEEFLKKI